MILSRELSTERASLATADYRDMYIVRHGHLEVMAFILDHRANFSAYAATYVLLAQALRAPLLTLDAPLARAARTHTSLAVLPDD